MMPAAPIDASPQELCDWLELSALTSDSGLAFIEDVNAELEIEQDFEASQGEDGELRERRRDDVVRQLIERRDVMQASYPFTISSDYSRITLRPDRSDGGEAYLFCLVVSNFQQDCRLLPTPTPDIPTGRRLFQICATLALAGLIQGSSYSIGWPRLDGSTFLAKLHEIFSAFGDGAPRVTFEDWMPKAAKDDGIDVIAWKCSPDRTPAAYALAQAASGANWRDKSVKAQLDLFHDTWFTRKPATIPQPVMVMPHVFLGSDPEAGADGEVETQARLAARVRKSYRVRVAHGVIIYRFLVATYIDLSVGVRKSHHVEDDDISKLSDFVSTYVAAVKTASAA